MMSTSHLQQFNHGGLNGSQETFLPNEGKPKKRFASTLKPKKSPDVALSLAESAKQELAVVPAKTPVSILQELLSRRGTTPNYELVQIEGAIHEPTFRYRVTVGEYIAIGFGRSKKEAKHAAAKNVLDKIVGNPVNEELPVSEEKPELPLTGAVIDKTPGNPIGSLQELCMSRRWPPPLYGLNAEEGLPHERQFTMTCTVNKHKETGSGKSKKLAKRQAAHKMWEYLHSESAAAVDDEAVESSEAAIARFASLKTSKISTLAAPNTQKVAAFHKCLKTRAGAKLELLQVEEMSNVNFNCIQFLQDLASEQHFEVTYVDIEETSRAGHSQCLVQISTMPVAVCYGSGPTPNDAKAAAALNALEYLKIMTRK